MKKKVIFKLKNLYAPLLILFIAFIANVSPVIKDGFEMSFLSEDFSVVLSALCILCVAMYFLIDDFLKKLKEENFRKVKLSLRMTKSQPNSLNTWSKDERFVSGSFRIYAIADKEKVFLLEIVIRYGELTDPSASSEKQIDRIVELDNWDFLDKITHYILEFEPIKDDAAVRTSALYERDDLEDYLFENLEMNPELAQVLIYTYGLKENVPAYLETFSKPATVLNVSTNHRPYKEENLPTLFNVVGSFHIEIEGEKHVSSSVSSDKAQLMHEFAISAWMSPGGPGIVKSLLDYKVSLETMIGEKGES